MDSKKANWLFFTVTVFHFVVVYGIGLLSGKDLGIVANLVSSELILLVPAAAFLVFAGGSVNEKLGFHKMKPGTWGMVILFTFLTMPLTTLVNAISMLFVDNVVVGISGDVTNMPFFLMLFLMGVYGPVCEEITFRGLMFRGYRGKGSLLGATLLSALAFGLMHMNFNQIPYAFVIGILLALLVEATGSIWSSVLYHFIFNAQSVCMMYLNKSLLADYAQQGAAVMEGDGLLYVIGVYAVYAALGTAAAAGVLLWIAGHEQRACRLQGIWKNRGQKTEKMVTLPFAAALLICLSYAALLAAIG